MQFFTSRSGSCDAAFGVVRLACALHLLHVYVKDSNVMEECKLNILK